jgi:hypothetical protein
VFTFLQRCLQPCTPPFRMAVNPMADEGVLPVGTPMATTSIAQFIRCNPRLGTMRAKRDSNGMEKRGLPLSTRTFPWRGLCHALPWP